MKKLILPILCIFVLPQLNAQSTIYGIQSDAGTSTNYFVSVDPSTAAITQVNSLSGLDNINTGTATINEQSGYYLFTTKNENLIVPADIIYTVDINTGAILSNPTLSTPVNELNYDNIGGNYYGIEYEDTTTSGTTNSGGLNPVTYTGVYYLVSAVPSTGVVTRINNISGIINIENNNSAYDAANEEFVFVGNDVQIFTIDATTGNIVSNPTLSTSIKELQLDPQTGIYYALEYEAGSGTYYLVTVNPTTGIVTRVNSISGLSNITDGTANLDDANGLYTIVDDNDYLLSIDLATANVSTNPQLNSSVSDLVMKVSLAAEFITTNEFNQLQYDDNNASNAQLGKHTSSADITIQRLSNTDYSMDDISDVKVYPNPASDKLNFEVNSLTSVEAYDINGQLMESEMIINTTTNMDVSEYPKGIYYLRISNDTKTITKKIIIQ